VRKVKFSGSDNSSSNYDDEDDTSQLQFDEESYNEEDFNTDSQIYKSGTEILT